MAGPRSPGSFRALAAFSGCLYSGALRPEEEAIVLRLAHCHLPRQAGGR